VWKWIKAFASPEIFYNKSRKIIPWTMAGFLILFFIALYGALFVVPADYQQGESYRIMFIHVPAASLSMATYAFMAITGAIGLIWNIKLAFVVSKSAASIGAVFAFLALFTGSLWGKPMWGSWWVWDARLTSELILLFLFFAVMSLNSAFDNPKTSGKASSILGIVGLINLPIIHYSVVWWNTLHQGPSISSVEKVVNPAIHESMIWPLLIMLVAYGLMMATLVLIKSRNEILFQSQNSRWVKEIVMGGK
jgi:heme exporter protein C